MKNKNLQLTYKMVITAILTSLAFAGTFIQIKMPTGDMIHLGNFVCIMAALLCGGTIGGISGSIGMGLYDLYGGYPMSTTIRTFVLKFVVGYVAGTLFRFVVKNNKKTKPIFIALTCFFITLFIISITLILMGTFEISKFGSNVEVVIFGSPKTLLVSCLIPIFSFIFSSFLIIATIYSKKLSKFQRAVLLSVTVAIIINVVCEFVVRIFLPALIDGLKIEATFITACTKIPGSIITGFLTVVLVVFIYTPVYIAIREFNLLNDLDDFYNEQ